MKRLFKTLLVLGISVASSITFASTSFADRECAISATGDPVEICISNTIYGGGGSSGGSSLIYGIRPMSALVI